MKACPVHGPKMIGPPTIKKVDIRTGEDVEVTNPKAGQCYACLSHNEKNGKGKRQPLREKGVQASEEYPGAPPGKAFSKEQFLEWWEGLKSDPVRWAAFMADTRRPGGVNKRAYGIAIRKAGHENMLNADKKCITKALGYKERGLSDRAIKGQIKERLIVKPLSLANAKAGRTSTFWGERLWLIYTLRYSRGYVVVTDTGHESKVFPTIGELKSATRKSGWEIVR